MLPKLLLAWALMAVCVAIHAVGLTFAILWVRRRASFMDGNLLFATWMLIRVAGWVLLLHLLEISLWAFVYDWGQSLPDLDTAFSGARKNHLDLSVGIALGSASQIALFVAPVLVLASYFLGPSPMDLSFWPGAVVMILTAALTAALVTSSGRSAWFVGVLVLMVYFVFAMTLYLLPPAR